MSTSPLYFYSISIFFSRHQWSMISLIFSLGSIYYQICHPLKSLFFFFLFLPSQKKRSLACINKRANFNEPLLCLLLSNRSSDYPSYLLNAGRQRKENACNCSRMIWFLTVHFICTAQRERYSSSSSLSLCTSFMSRSNLYEKFKAIMISQEYEEGRNLVQRCIVSHVYEY